MLTRFLRLAATRPFFCILSISSSSSSSSSSWNWNWEWDWDWDCMQKKGEKGKFKSNGKRVDKQKESASVSRSKRARQRKGKGQRARVFFIFKEGNREKSCTPSGFDKRQSEAITFERQRRTKGLVLLLLLLFLAQGERKLMMMAMFSALIPSSTTWTFSQLSIPLENTKTIEILLTVEWTTLTECITQLLLLSLLFFNFNFRQWTDWLMLLYTTTTTTQSVN